MASVIKSSSISLSATVSGELLLDLHFAKIKLNASLLFFLFVSWKLVGKLGTVNTVALGWYLLPEIVLKLLWSLHYASLSVDIYLPNPICVWIVEKCAGICACVHVCLRTPPLIETRWRVETVNVFPWISVVSQALIDSDLTALHALSYS